MSWLKDLNEKRIFKYRFDDGSEVTGTRSKLQEIIDDKQDFQVKAEPGEVLVIGGKKAYYGGFEPIKMGGKTSVTFEKNGRKARMIEKVMVLSNTILRLNFTTRRQAELSLSTPKPTKSSCRKKQLFRKEKKRPWPRKTSPKTTLLKSRFLLFLTESMYPMALTLETTTLVKTLPLIK